MQKRDGSKYAHACARFTLDFKTAAERFDAFAQPD